MALGESGLPCAQRPLPGPLALPKCGPSPCYPKWARWAIQAGSGETASESGFEQVSDSPSSPFG